MHVYGMYTCVYMCRCYVHAEIQINKSVICICETCTCIHVVSMYITRALYIHMWHVQLFEVCIMVCTGTAYICNYHVWSKCTCVEHIAHKQLNSIYAPEEACLSASSTVLSPLHPHTHTSCSFNSGFQVIDWAHRLLYPNKRGYQRGGDPPLRILDQFNH